MNIKYKKMDKKTFKIQPEIYEGVLYNNEILYMGQLDEGVVLFSFLKGYILIVDNEYHIETQTMNCSELSEFLDIYNKDYLDWNKNREKYEKKKVIYENGKFKVVDK